MRVEPATLDDAELLAQLNVSIQQFHCELIPEYFRPAAFDSVVAQLREMLSEPGAICFVAWIDEAPVGYCLAKEIERGPTAWSTAYRRLLVDQLSVNSQWRRRGIGTRLISQLTKFACERGIDELVLDYWSSNLVAKEFYQSLGFKPHTEQVLLKLPAASCDA
jgi:ribosomal protein S18 acetylase RimI-like enzyme